MKRRVFFICVILTAFSFVSATQRTTYPKKAAKWTVSVSAKTFTDSITMANETAKRLAWKSQTDLEAALIEAKSQDND